MAATSGFPQPFVPGEFLQDGSVLNAALALDGFSFADGQTAGTASVPSPITQVNTVYTTVAASAVALAPKAIPGTYFIVQNYGANTLGIKPNAATDTIDGSTSNATLSTANRAAMFACTVAGAWRSFLLGATTS
jgi:hypothetical protein